LTRGSIVIYNRVRSGERDDASDDIAAKPENQKESGTNTLGAKSWRDDPDSIGSDVRIEDGGEHAEYLAKATYSALDAIHAVHGDGGMPVVSVSVNPYLKNDLGMYHGIKGQRVGLSIEIKPDSQHAAFTIVHELGHFLDQWGGVRHGWVRRGV
jgi:hypothetical protein